MIVKTRPRFKENCYAKFKVFHLKINKNKSYAPFYFIMMCVWLVYYKTTCVWVFPTNWYTAYTPPFSQESHFLPLCLPLLLFYKCLFCHILSFLVKAIFVPCTKTQSGCFISFYSFVCLVLIMYIIPVPEC